MKKIVFIALILSFAIMSGGCAGVFGHKEYTDIGDYSKIFDLPEIRCTYAMEMFPKAVDSLDVKEFYLDWKLGVVGSADVQLLLSVTYDDLKLQEEIYRIEALANGNVVYDTESFECDAYVLVLGYDCTNYYVLIDGNTVHYVLLQLVAKKDIDIDRALLPKGYVDLGYVKNTSYNVYE